MSSYSSIQKRRQARFLLVQALYQWLLSDASFSEVLTQFELNPHFKKGDQDYFVESLRAIMQQAETLDKIYADFLDREVTELDPIEKSILRLSTYELSARLDIPYRVVINEGLELAKTFGATDSHKYINGVLDRVAKQLRKNEYV